MPPRNLTVGSRAKNRDVKMRFFRNDMLYISWSIISDISPFYDGDATSRPLVPSIAKFEPFSWVQTSLFFSESLDRHRHRGVERRAGSGSADTSRIRHHLSARRRRSWALSKRYRCCWRSPSRWRRRRSSKTAPSSFRCIVLSAKIKRVKMSFERVIRLRRVSLR